MNTKKYIVIASVTIVVLGGVFISVLATVNYFYPEPTINIIPIRDWTAKQVQNNKPVIKNVSAPKILDINTSHCNVKPDANGNCPAGCVNYGNPLGCVTQEYQDYCSFNPGQCPY